MKRKVLVVLFNLDRAREHEWYAQLMDQSRYEIHFILINRCEGHFANFLKDHGFQLHCFHYAAKIDLLKISYSIYRLIRKQQYDIVHTHLFESSISGILASWVAGTPVRIVTRHHSDFHHLNSPLGVFMDKLINRLSTHVIAVSRVVRDILIKKEGVHPDKISLIPHGIDTQAFGEAAVEADRVHEIRRRLVLNDGIKVIGSVSRFIQWKGVQHIIDAFIRLREKRSDVILVLANALGPYESVIMKKLGGLPKESYRLVKFEEDMPALYRCFDCFVHVPVTPTAEAFGQTYIEALASKVPSVITVSGVANDYAENEVNCLVVPYQDSKAIADAIQSLLDGRVDLVKMLDEGRLLVERNYDFKLKYLRIDQLYNRLLEAAR